MSEPATPVTVTLPADWRSELKSEVTSAARDKPWLGGETAVEMVEDWIRVAAPVVSGDVEADTAKLSDSLKLAIAAADRRQARIDTALAVCDRYDPGLFPLTHIRAALLGDSKEEKR